MPTADPFIFHGVQSFNAAGTQRGELFTGFPLTTAVDVTDMPDWVTLGGTRKGQTPTAEQIALSRVNAARLYWCLHGVAVDTAGGDLGESASWAGIVPFQTGRSSDGQLDGVDVQPAARATMAGLALGYEPAYWSTGLRLLAYTSATARRMYASGEFVGFGCEPCKVTSLAGNGESGVHYSSCYLGSWMEAPDASWPSHSSAVREIDGLPLIQQDFVALYFDYGGRPWSTAAITGFSWWTWE